MRGLVAYKLYCVLVLICVRAACGDWQSAITAGAVSYQQGRLIEAANSYRVALKDAESFMPGDSRRLRTFRAFASVLRDENKLHESENIYKRALSESEKVLGPNDPETAAVLNGLGLLSERSGSYAQAEGTFRRALDVYQTSVGPNTRQVAFTLNNIGSVYVCEQRYDLAEPVLQQALNILHKIGDSGLGAADALSNLAAVKRNLGRDAEADRLYGTSIAIYEQKLGPVHPKLATALSNRAVLLTKMKRQAEADLLFRRSIACFEEAVGPDSPGLLPVLGSYASLLRAMHRKGDAKELEKRAAGISARHPEIKIAAMSIDANSLLPERE
jgi:tetratricopeptide (TPR) repeat protein